jgi:pyrimidine-nucleoside phosphorylase
MITSEILRKKRDGNELSQAEILYLIEGITANTVNEAQAAAFLMASCIRGLSARETAALTFAMRDSGERMDFSFQSKPVVDKHSTGGVGDKISLPLLPIVVACGAAVPMISGRGLGHTGGTVDKMESIRGLSMDLDSAQRIDMIQSHGAFFAKQTNTIAPADRTLYHTRDITGTVESVGLITASILSKKLSEGLDALVMDIKVGKGAFMPTLSAARELAEMMIGVAREVGLSMRIVFTAMNEPIGNAVGNWIEVEESIAVLEGHGPADTIALTERLAMSMLLATDIAKDEADALTKVRTVIQSGLALRTFENIVSSQGGNLSASKAWYAEQPYTNTIIEAPHAGLVTDIHAREIGLAGIGIRAGRRITTDTLDYGAGIVLCKKVGSHVLKGEPMAEIRSLDRAMADAIRNRLSQAFTIDPSADTPMHNGTLILDEWTI